MTFSARRGVAAAVAVLAMLLAGPAAAEPVKCAMGAYLVSLSQVDAASGTFRADFWMWSVCPTRDIEPLKTVEFVNGVETAGTLDSMIQRGDQWWATRKFAGVFRQDFSLANYPFDEEPLTIGIEEGVLDTRDLVYVPDTSQSGMDPGVHLAGWKLKGFKVLGGVADHPTTYGDPSLDGGSSRYAALTLRVGVERNHVGNFLKATFPVYISVLLALVSLLVADGRPGLLGASLFTVVLSFVSVEKLVGPHDGVYLLDTLHFAALALILSATAWGIVSLRVRAHHGADHTLPRRDPIAAAALGGVYLLANIVLVALAIARAKG